jgi:hypothetical protein
VRHVAPDFGNNGAERCIFDPGQFRKYDADILYGENLRHVFDFPGATRPIVGVARLPSSAICLLIENDSRLTSVAMALQELL